MEDIYVQAIQEIEDTGKLLLMTRQLLCAKQKKEINWHFSVWKNIIRMA